MSFVCDICGIEILGKPKYKSRHTDNYSSPSFNKIAVCYSCRFPNNENLES